MQRIQFVGVYPGAKSPVTFEEIHTRKFAALEQFYRLFRATCGTTETIAAKLCLNTNNTRPWKGSIALSRFMSVKKEQYSIDTLPQPGSTVQAEGRFELHYYQLCGEYLDKAVTVCNDDSLCIDLLLLIEKAAKENKHVSAYVLVVLDFNDIDLVTHTSFENIDLFFSQFPNVLVGGMHDHQIKEHHRRLFPAISPE